MSNITIVVNDIKFTPRPDCNYKYDYVRLASIIKDKSRWHEEIPAQYLPEINEDLVAKAIWRNVIMNDLWFILHFVLKTPGANRPFIVNSAKIIEENGDWVIHLWARGHFKSSLRKARNIQRLLKYPKKCQMIVSHTRPAAKKHMRPIMLELENNVFLQDCFPDVLYKNPRNESPKWSEDDGLVTKGHEDSRPEANIEAHGVKEGMPIGVHFDWIEIDDLETPADVRNPDIVMQGRETVDLCNFLLTEDGAINFWGTPYSHEGLYVPHVTDKKKADGTPKYKYIRQPATDDGTRTGNPVLWTREKFNDMVAEMEADGGQYAVNCQLLINPTPVGATRFNSRDLIEVTPDKVPKDVLVVMAVDPAGNDTTGKGDSWAILTVAIDLSSGQLGGRNVYIIDALITPLKEAEAPHEIARMYLKAGIVQKIGVEKVGQSTAELHVKSALAERGRRIDIDDGSLVILRPGGLRNALRIERYLATPFKNEQIHISTAVPSIYRERLRNEMDKFPFWHRDDGLTALAYVFNMIQDMDLSRHSSLQEYDYSPQAYEFSTFVG